MCGVPAALMQSAASIHRLWGCTPYWPMRIGTYTAAKPTSSQPPSHPPNCPCQVAPAKIEEACGKAKAGHFQLACAAAWEGKHGCVCESGINHPNQVGGRRLLYQCAVLLAELCAMMLCAVCVFSSASVHCRTLLNCLINPEPHRRHLTCTPPPPPTNLSSTMRRHPLRVPLALLKSPPPSHKQTLSLPT